MRRLQRAWSIGACLLLAGVFFYAGLVKAWDPTAFAARIHAVRLAPDRLVNVTAVTLPWMEMAAAAALFSGRLRGGGLLLLMGMLAVFMAVEASVMWRGLDISCGCFAPSRGSGPVGGMTLLRNFLLFSMAWVAFRRKRRP